MRELDHRGVTWVTRPRLGFKSCAAAQAALSGIELMHLLKKDQWIGAEGPGSLRHPSKFATEPGAVGHWYLCKATLTQFRS
jgi:hypothetical protein